MAATQLRFTGERVIPDRYELKPMLQEHLARYNFALSQVQGATALDLGCGCGYGTHLLATRGARKAVGVDWARDAIGYACTHYREPNLTFEVMDVTALTYPDNSFTAVVCLEVLEHVEDYAALVKEAVRVLAPGGTLVISTPNKLVWSSGRDQPVNPWHIHEFTREEFAQLIETYVSDVEYWCQTTTTPGIIPIILANLRLQGYYVRTHSPTARLVEWSHNAFMKAIMLPPHLIPGAMDKDPNLIVPAHELPLERQYYFLAVGHKPLASASDKS